MKIFDPKRHLPVGWDWEGTRNGLIWGHILSAFSIFSYFSRLSDALTSLYIYRQLSDGTLLKELVPTRTMVPFPELIAGFPLMGLACFLAVMPSLVWRYYRFHTRGAMAVYTMRRLPDRWEYHRRCWTQPILSALFELLIFAVLVGLCWLIWRFATPAPCLPH